MSTVDELIAGLRALADFYEQHPDMPAPPYPDFIVHTVGEDDAQEVEQVRAAAELLGVEAKTTCGHFKAERHFGPIHARVVHIPRTVMANHNERMSYADNVKTGDGAK